mgnify:CR=1 FL=1
MGEELGKLTLDGQEAARDLHGVDGGREASGMGAVQPAGDLVEVAADPPHGQYKRRINAGGGLAAAGICAAKGFAQKGRHRDARDFGLLPKLGHLERVSNARAVKEMGMEFIAPKAALLASADWLVKPGKIWA